MRGSPSAFAQAREEIQLWPAAAMGYYVTLHSSWVVLGLFLVSIWTGATTYKMHEALRAVLTEEKSITRVRRRVSRDRRGGEATLFETGVDVWEAFSPGNRPLKFVVLAGLVVNLGLGLYQFWWLGSRVIGTPSPSVPEISLFSLPVLMLAAMGASIVWSQ